MAPGADHLGREGVIELLPALSSSLRNELWRVDASAEGQRWKKLYDAFAAKVVRPGVFTLGGEEAHGAVVGAMKVYFYGRTPSGDLLILEAFLVETM